MLSTKHFVSRKRNLKHTYVTTLVPVLFNLGHYNEENGRIAIKKQLLLMGLYYLRLPAND